MLSGAAASLVITPTPVAETLVRFHSAVPDPSKGLDIRGVGPHPVRKTRPSQGGPGWSSRPTAGSRSCAVAVGRTILQIAYHLIAHGTTYQELGADYFDRFNRERATKRLVQRLEALGFEVRLAERVRATPSLVTTG